MLWDIKYILPGYFIKVVSKYSGIEIDQIDLLVVLQLKVHVFQRIQFAEVKVMSK